MGTTNVKWITGKRFVGIDSTNHSVVLATADEGVGVKPSDLLPMGLATCTSVDVVEILTKKRMTPTLFEVSVESEQDADPPWTFRKFHLHFKLSGEKLTEQAVQQAIQLAEQKYCSVAATIRGTAEILTTFEIV